MQKSKVKNLVGIGLFTAIVVLLQFLGGSIRFGMFSISLVLIPIVVGSAVYGWGAGAWLGYAFAMTVLLSGDAGPFLAVNPLGTVLVVVLKGILCGLSAGLVYKALYRYTKFGAVLCAALICPIVNTGVFLIGCRVFFFETISGWASAAGFPSAGNYMFLGLAGINFLIEVGINLLLAPAIVRLIRIGKKQ